MCKFYSYCVHIKVAIVLYSMLVTLSSRILSNLCLIPAFYAKIPTFNAKVPDLCANICLFGFHCAGNLHGCVILIHLRFVSNDGAHTMRG